MDKSLSALNGMKTPEAPSGAVIMLEDVFPFSLHQIAAWPDTMIKAGTVAAKQIGCASAPDPGHAMIGSAGALLRVEPLKWWLISPDPDVAPPRSRTHRVLHWTCRIPEHGSGSVVTNPRRC